MSRSAAVQQGRFRVVLPLTKRLRVPRSGIVRVYYSGDSHHVYEQLSRRIWR